MGPGEPVVGKIRNEFLNTILIKIPRDQGKLGLTKAGLITCAQRLQENKTYRTVKIVFDVDPL
jgi:primosomal protein N' (replication factor Y)